MDDLIASFSTCMNENFQMDDVMSAVSRIKVRGSSSSTSSTHYVPAMAAQTDVNDYGMGEWTTVMVEDDDEDWDPRAAQKDREFDAYTPAQQTILKKMRASLRHRDAVCFEARKALGYYTVLHDELVQFSNTLADARDAWTHTYEISYHHLEPERPAAQRLQLALRRLGDLERWWRIVTPWAIDFCQRMEPFYGRLKDMVSKEKANLENLKEQYIPGSGITRSSYYDVLKLADVFHEFDSVHLDFEKDLKFPKVFQIPAPPGARGYEYFDWPSEERALVDRAANIFCEAVEGARLWKLF